MYLLRVLVLQPFFLFVSFSSFGNNYISGRLLVVISIVRRCLVFNNFLHYFFVLL